MGLVKKAEAQAQQAFQEYVTSTAFQITLNKNQVQLLYYLYRYGYARGNQRWQRHRDAVLDGRRADFVQIVKALIRRGLVLHNWIDAKEQNKNWKTETHPYYLVTKAGKLVAKMLILSGVVQEFKAGKFKVAA